MFALAVLATWPLFLLSLEDPVRVDGVLADAEWTAFASSGIRTPLVDVRMQNTQTHLWVAIAFLADDGAGERGEANGRGGDTFWLFLDVDGDGRHTAQRDVALHPSSDASRLLLARSNGRRWERPAALAGATLASGRAAATAAHPACRTWEVGVPLDAIGVGALDTLSWALQLVSPEPELTLVVPAGASSDFGRMQATQLSPYRLLGERPTTPAVARPALGERAMRVDRERLGALGTAESVAPEVVDRFRSTLSAVVGRRILADGTVEIRYADGTVERHSESGIDITLPDGNRMSKRFIEVVPTFPSEPPTESEGLWLEEHASRLLDHIRTLTLSQEDAVDNYLRREAERASDVYERIYWRTRCIGILL